MESSADYLRLIEKLHNDGQEALEKYSGAKYPRVGLDQLVAVCQGLASDICDYNLTNCISPKKHDTTKWVCFGAAALVKRYGAEYNSVPLFYGYSFLLGESLRGTGMLIESIGDVRIYCENLQGFLAQGQYLAPFCFFRGLDLAFNKCAKEVIKGLQGEVRKLTGEEV